MLQLLNNQSGIWEQIGNFFYRFFNPKLEGYTNFDFGKSALTIQIIIFGIFAGVLLASFSMIFIKTTLGRLVRALLEKSAFAPESALTLTDCGLEKHFFIRRALKHGYTLRRVVRCVEEEEYFSKIYQEQAAHEAARAEAKKNGQKLPPYRAPRFTQPLSLCHFYIPEKDRYAAEMRFHEKGSGYLTFFFVLLGCVICICLIFALLPQLLRFFDNVISLFSVKGNTIR